MFQNRRRTATGIILLAVILFFTGCASTQTATSKKETDTAAPERTQQQPPPAKTVKHAEPLNSSLISSKFQQEKTASVQKIAVSQADVEFVEQRLLAYEKKFRQWLEVADEIQESDGPGALPDDTECEQQFERILAGYSLLFERMLRNTTVSIDKLYTVDPTRMQQLDIAFLESRCAELLGHDTMFADDFLAETEELPSFDQLEEQVADHLAAGNYQNTIFSYMQLLRLYPSRIPNFNTQYQFGLALQHTGQVEAAARYYNKMFSSAAQPIGPASLQRQIADLLLAAGDPAAAIASYETLNNLNSSYAAEKKWADEQLAFLRNADPDSEEMIAYMKLLREFMTNDYKIHGAELNEKLYTFALDYAGNPITDNALRLKAFSESQLRFWFGQQLIKVDSLVAQKNFQEGLETLNQLSGYYLSLELQAVLKRTFYEVTLAEARETEAQRQLEEMALIDQWDSAVNLLDSQHYDTAILAFQAFQETEYADQAQAKITEAANLAAGQMRKEAASLFIKAGKTADIERKKELLLASHKLLKEILVSYPQTDLLDKVNQNISVLEEQIRRIDPALLEESPEEQNPGEEMQEQMSGHRF